MTSSSQTKISIREALIDDRRVIWEWWNDPVTRSMMAKKDFVPWQEHCAWFDKVLLDESRILCLGLDVEDQKVGVVRFDLQTDRPGTYEVSINLNPEFRGRGFAPALLRAAVSYLSSVRTPEMLFANVGEIANVPSQKTFLSAGFVAKADPVYTFHYELQIR